MPSRAEVEKEIERRSLLRSHLEFTRHFFAAAQGQTFSVGPHHEVMCGTLDAVFRGEIKRLIINVPPGYSKTSLAVVNFIARGLAINPASRFIHASYAQSLALDNSSLVRELINLEAYQAHWPIALKADTNAKGLWRTMEGGHVRAAASGEPITGFRAGRLMQDGEPWSFSGALLIDDPVKPDDVSSETTRKFVNDRWHNTFKSRLGDESVPVIVIMQRLHVDDFVASLLETSGERWHVLKLPVWIDGECAPIHRNAIMVPHGLPPGPLWPQKHDEKQIEVLRARPLEFAGQYMQEPTVAGGNLFRAEWLGEYDTLPALQWRGIYVDTAQKTKERNDFTVFEHWGAGSDGRAYLIDVVRGRFEAPELEATAIALWGRCKAMDPERYGFLREMAVEDKVSGTGLIQGLARKAIPVRAIQRDKDKLMRGHDVAPSVAAGLVVIPREAPWKSEFIAELLAFPDGAFDDQVDPLMDAIVAICGLNAYDLRGAL